MEYIEAFDCVMWNKLWNVLNEIRLPVHFILLHNDVGYGNNKKKVKVNDDESRNLLRKNYDSEKDIIRRIRLDLSVIIGG